MYKEIWFILNTVVGCISWREILSLLLLIEICFPLCWADTNKILAFETDVLQTGEKNQPVLYNIVSFQDHQYRASSSESCLTLMLLDMVKIASYVYITLHCLFCEIMWSSRYMYLRLEQNIGQRSYRVAKLTFSLTLFVMLITMINYSSVLHI